MLDDLQPLLYKQPKCIEIILHDIDVKDLSDININFNDNVQYKTETVRSDDGSYKYTAEPITQEIIKCVDCKYHEGRCYCSNSDVYGFGPADFCSLAERKEDE